MSKTNNSPNTLDLQQSYQDIRTTQSTTDLWEEELQQSLSLFEFTTPYHTNPQIH